MQSDATETDGRMSRGQQTRERLINAALRLFAEKGYAGVGIRDGSGRSGDQHRLHLVSFRQ